MKYLSWDSKEAWVRSVKVGDTICDCSYRHLKVVEKPSCCDINDTDDKCDCNIYDLGVMLENGNWCNLMNCADPVPHPDDWHNE